MRDTPTRDLIPTALLLGAATLALILTACGGGYGGGGGGTSTGMGCSAYGGTCPAPTVKLSVPAASSYNRSVTLSATAAASSGSVSSVEFLVDGASVGTVSAAPFTLSWDSTTVSDGTHSLTAMVTDSTGQTATSAAVTISVDNNPAFTVTLSPAQLFPAPTSSATGTAGITVKLASGAASGKVTLTGITATAVTLNQAFAGDSGSGLVTLSANAGTPGEWDVPASATLTTDQLNALMEGGLYLIVTSAANPGGELRGQLMPSGISVVFATLTGAQEVPAVTSSAAALAAVTVDAGADLATVELHDSGVTDATAATMNTAASGATGPQLLSLTQDSADPTHWSAQLASVTATAVSDFRANEWYVNILTATAASGLIRAQFVASTTPPPPPPATPTLTQLTSTVFAVCGNCHTGGGSSLPASMDLRAGHIYASIVGVASVEQPGLLRVKPGDAADSYVVQKLEGAPTIAGARMPFGGPYLSQALIDQLQAWINAGAANN